MRKLKVLLLSSILLLSIGFIAYSYTYLIKQQIVSVTTTATKLPTTPVVGRKYILLQNVGTVTVYIGGSTVTADTASTGGYQLLPYMSWYENYDHTIDVYGIVASGTANVVVLEGK